MHMIIKRLIKWLVRVACIFLPEAKAHELERWRRGREEFWKYNRCQYIFASYGKSGRTWVRVMISRYFQLVYKLPDNMCIDTAYMTDKCAVLLEPDGATWTVNFNTMTQQDSANPGVI
jgi:hypothetical protein